MRRPEKKRVFAWPQGRLTEAENKLITTACRKAVRSIAARSISPRMRSDLVNSIGDVANMAALVEKCMIESGSQTRKPGP